MPNTLSQLIKELNRLYLLEKKEMESVQQEKEIQFLRLLEELGKSYEQEKERIYKEVICPFIDQYPFLNQKSSFSIIEEEEYEIYHSRYLLEIWNCQNESLADFLKAAEVEEKWIDKVSDNRYSIQKEYPTINGMKMDLLIKDDAGKWLIGIENKVKASVHINEHRGLTQLKCYEKDCQQEFPGYDKLFILLSHRNNKSYVENSNWKYVDYYSLMGSLLKYYRNDIVRDYLKTLYAVLFGNEQFNNQDTSLYNYNSFINRIISKLH